MAPSTSAGRGESETCRKPVFPVELRRAGASGATVIEYFAAADGTVEKAQVLKSSGFEALDQLALSSVLSCKRVTPGTVKGVPTAMWSKVTFSWELK